MKGCAHARKPHPLGHCLEVIHRFAALDLDDPAEPLAVHEHEVREHRVLADLERRDLLVSDVDAHVELFLVLCLKKSNKAVVLELLSDWSDKNRRHTASQPLGRLPETTQTSHLA